MRDVLTAHHLHAGSSVVVCSFRGTAAAATVTAVEPHSNHLGGRWATLTLELEDGELVEVDSRQHVIITPEYVEHGYCPECRSRREVDERFGDSHLEHGRERSYTVTRFVCGHTDETTGTDRPVADGAPYAGPDVAVARGTSVRDLRDAREHQARIDARNAS